MTRLRSYLQGSLKDFIPELPPSISRRALAIEIIILLALSLGESGVRAAVRLLRFVTLEGGGFNKVSQAKVSMSNIDSVERPIYDVVSQLLDVAFAWAPVALAAWLLWNSRTPIQEVWIKTKTGTVQYLTGSDFLRAVGIASAVGGVGIGFYLLSHSLGFAVTVGVGESHDTWRYWFHLLTDSLATAVLEECIVLGYFLVRLRQLGVGVGKALTFAAILRGSYHLYQGLWGFVGNFFMGLAFGYLYLRWGRVMPLVVAHFLMDAVAFIGLALLAGRVGWIPV